QTDPESTIGDRSYSQQRWTVLHHEIRKSEQQLRHQRKHGLETRKNPSKGGNDENIDDDDGNAHYDDNENRIAQGLGNLVFDFPFELDVVEEPEEDLFQRSGQLAHAHHAEVERTEHLAVPAHGAGKVSDA